MARTTIGFVTLATLLVVTNLWWAFQLLDSGVTQTHIGVSLNDNQIALSQTIAVAKEATRPGSTRESIVAAAMQGQGEINPFEKDGYLWVGRIGLKFYNDGRLQDVARAWSPP